MNLTRTASLWSRVGTGRPDRERGRPGTGGAARCGEEALGAANRMERELQETLERIEELGGVMQDMAAASQEQAATGQEMTASMDQISRATQGIVEALREVREQAQTGAEAARQVAHSSQTLAGGAARAEEQVKRFRTEAP